MRVATAAAAIVAALVLAACGSDESGSAASSEGTIKLGAWFPLTGPIASSGIPQRDGAKAAFEKVNAEGGINGRKIEYITRDNAFDPQQTIQAARQLIGEDEVVAIAGSNGTATSAAAFPFVMDQNKVPMLNLYGGAADWYDPPKPLLFGYQTLYEEQAAAAGAWAAEDGHKNIVVVHSDPAAFEQAAKYAEPGAKTVAPDVKFQTVVSKFQTTDYSPIVGEVKSKNPDAVIVILSFPEASAYLKQAKLQGLDAPAYGYAPNADEGVIGLAGADAEGFKSISLTKPAEEPGAEMDEYRDALKATAPKAKPTANSVAAYAGAVAVAEVLKTIDGDVTSESIAKAFENAGTIETGILPPLSWSADKHLGTTDVQRVEVKDGKWVAVGDFVTPPPVVG